MAGRNEHVYIQNNTAAGPNGYTAIGNKHVSGQNDTVANENHTVSSPNGYVATRNEHVSGQNNTVANGNHTVTGPNGYTTIRNEDVPGQNNTVASRNEHTITGHRTVFSPYDILSANNKTPAMCRGFPMTRNDTVPV
ncbi:hypothetical protein [Sinomicrobium sp. M5D2P17]